MTCPHCKHSRSRVIDSRSQSDGTTYRRRECSRCHQRYSTFEVRSAELIQLRNIYTNVLVLQKRVSGKEEEGKRT